jgi:hypothetical protein
MPHNTRYFGSRPVIRAIAGDAVPNSSAAARTGGSNSPHPWAMDCRVLLLQVINLAAEIVAEGQKGRTWFRTGRVTVDMRPPLHQTQDRRNRVPRADNQTAEPWAAGTMARRRSLPGAPAKAANTRLPIVTTSSERVGDPAAIEQRRCKCQVASPDSMSIKLNLALALPMSRTATSSPGIEGG